MTEGICNWAKEKNCWEEYKCTHALKHHIVYGCKTKCGRFNSKEPTCE